VRAKIKLVISNSFVFMFVYMLQSIIIIITQCEQLKTFLKFLFPKNPTKESIHHCPTWHYRLHGNSYEQFPSAVGYSKHEHFFDPLNIKNQVLSSFESVRMSPALER